MTILYDVPILIANVRSEKTGILYTHDAIQECFDAQHYQVIPGGLDFNSLLPGIYNDKFSYAGMPVTENIGANININMIAFTAKLSRFEDNTLYANITLLETPMGHILSKYVRDYDINFRTGSVIRLDPDTYIEYMRIFAIRTEVKEF